MINADFIVLILSLCSQDSKKSGRARKALRSKKDPFHLQGRPLKIAMRDFCKGEAYYLDNSGAQIQRSQPSETLKKPREVLSNQQILRIEDE